jgi:hypothetical protein
MIYDDLDLSSIEGWLLPEEAQWLHGRAKKSKRVLEIGCFMGRSTCAILAATTMKTGPHSMVVIDTFDARGTSRGEEFRGDEELVFRRFIWNLRGRNLPLPLVIIGEAYQARLFSPQFDFIFIDASHDEASVRDDLETARRVALPGCTVAVHDYDEKDPERAGLVKAVRDFFEPALPIVDAGSIAWGRL